MSGLAILDLGYGNTHSVALAFERLGASPKLTNRSTDAERADRLVVPGVGAAGSAMQRLRANGIDDVLRRRSRPTLGICLGMQLLFERSAEDGGTDLLAILPGDVEPIVPAPGFPVPHMGWSRLETVADGLGLVHGDYAYFAHGYACPDGEATAVRVNYGAMRVPAAVRIGALWGAQFHPERSSAAGARFLAAFLAS